MKQSDRIFLLAILVLRYKNISITSEIYFSRVRLKYMNLKYEYFIYKMFIFK